MIKIIGLLMIVGGCTGIGVFIDHLKRVHIEELAELIKCYEMIRGDIEYRLTPMIEACENVSEMTKTQIGKLFSSYASLLKARESGDANMLWHKAIDENKSSLHLEEEEYALLEQFGVALGYLDKQMQQKNIDMLLKEMNKQFDCQKEKYQRASKMYRGLGILAGVCISIILV